MPSHVCPLIRVLDWDCAVRSSVGIVGKVIVGLSRLAVPDTEKSDHGHGQGDPRRRRRTRGEQGQGRGQGQGKHKHFQSHAYLRGGHNRQIPPISSQQNVDVRLTYQRSEVSLDLCEAKALRFRRPLFFQYRNRLLLEYRGRVHLRVLLSKPFCLIHLCASVSVLQGRRGPPTRLRPPPSILPLP